MLRNILLAAVLLVGSAFTPLNTAFAGPILTQQFLTDDGAGNLTSFGTLSIDLDTIGEWGEVTEWEMFTLFGFEMGENFGFTALYDETNLAAGFTFLQFDVSDIDATFAFQGFWEMGFGEGFLDVFTVQGDFVTSGSFVMGNTQLVSAPGTLFLMFGAGAAALVLRRRK